MEHLIWHLYMVSEVVATPQQWQKTWDHPMHWMLVLEIPVLHDTNEKWSSRFFFRQLELKEDTLKIGLLLNHISDGGNFFFQLRIPSGKTRSWWWEPTTFSWMQRWLCDGNSQIWQVFQSERPTADASWAILAPPAERTVTDVRPMGTHIDRNGKCVQVWQCWHNGQRQTRILLSWWLIKVEIVWHGCWTYSAKDNWNSVQCTSWQRKR